MERIRQATTRHFTRLKSVGFAANLDKCEFGKKSINYFYSMENRMNLSLNRAGLKRKVHPILHLPRERKTSHDLLVEFFLLFLVWRMSKK